MSAKPKPYSFPARLQVKHLQKDLDDFVARCDSQPAGSEHQADLYQYAYVRLCGLLEQALLLVARSRVNQQTFGEARAHGLSFLERSQRNPTDDVILGFVRRFAAFWADELEDWFNTDDRGSRLNALVGIRNGNAHGTSYGGSAKWFLNYYVVVYELIEWLLDRFEPKILPKSTS